MQPMNTKPTPASQKTRRGGHRPGAGRKPAAPTGPRVNFAGARVHLYTNGLLAEEARRRGIGLGQLLDQFAEGLGDLQRVIYDVQRRAAQHDAYISQKTGQETQKLLGLPNGAFGETQKLPRVEISALDSLILGMIGIADAVDGISVATVFGAYDNAKHAVESFAGEAPEHTPKLSKAEIAQLDRLIAAAKRLQ